MTKDYFIMERSDIDRPLTDQQWKALRDWVSYMATQAMNAMTYLEYEHDWGLCPHGTLMAPWQNQYEECYACEMTDAALRVEV